MKIGQKLTLILLELSALVFSLVLPLVLMFKETFIGLEYKMALNFVWIIPLGVLAIVYFKYLKKILWRKLNARATVEEFGVQGASSPITIRIIRATELLLPLVPITGLIAMMSMIDTRLVLISMVTIGGFLLIGQVFLMIKDVLKHNWMIDIEARRKLKVEKRMDQMRSEDED